MSINGFENTAFKHFRQVLSSVANFSSVKQIPLIKAWDIARFPAGLSASIKLIKEATILACKLPSSKISPTAFPIVPPYLSMLMSKTKNGVNEKRLCV